MTLSSRAHLQEVEDLTLASVDHDTLRQAVLQLVTWIREDQDTRADRKLLLQLVREAYDLLHNADTEVDLRDWLRSAEPFLRG